MLASFDAIMLIFHHTFTFRENLRVLMKETAFRRNQEKNRGQIEPRKSQREASRNTHDRAWRHTTVLQDPNVPVRTHGPTHGRAWDRASTHGRAMSRTAVRVRCGAAFNPFSRYFWGHFLIPPFFLVFPLCSRVRERLERVLKTLD